MSSSKMGDENSYNEYERQRLENIRRNEEILKQLNIPEIVNSMKKKPKQKPKPKPKVKVEKKQPIRQSLRLRGVKPDLAPDEKRKVEEEAEKDKKRARLEGILALHAIRANKTSINDTNQFIGILSDLSMVKDSRKDDEADKVQTNDINFDTIPGGKEGFRAVRWRCRSLSLKQTEDKSAVKVTPERIYCISIHPSKDKILASAGDKRGSLGFWDVNESDTEESQTFMFDVHTETVSFSQYSPTNSNLLFTSSYDGSIRYLDLNKAKSMEAFVDNSYLFTHFDMDLTGNIIYFSTMGGTVGVKDIRQPTNIFTGYELHEKKVGCISLNKLRPELMVTASLDRTMCLWDVRKLGSDCKVQEFNFTKSVTSAYWSPTGDRVVSASYDDLLRVFNYSEERKLKECIQIPHNNQVGRWVTMFRATWNPNPNLHPHFVIGNMKRSSDVYSAVTGELIWNMRDETISSIPAVNAFHPKLNIIVSGNAFGRMSVWREKPKVTPVVLV